jgi:integrase
MLKHTIAKHLIREGLPVNEVQAWLGWRSLETALHYLKPDDEELSDRVGQTIRKKSGFHWTLQGELFAVASVVFHK